MWGSQTPPLLADASRPLVDPFGRAISYLRVSVTDRCDFRCVYCMSEDMTFLPKRDLLTLEELDRVCTVFVERGVRKLRITGGEPLVRRERRTPFLPASRPPPPGAPGGLHVPPHRRPLAPHRPGGTGSGERRGGEEEKTR